MPRPSNQDHIRLTMFRANQGFLGASSQSAKTSRGSRSGGRYAGLPSGNTAGTPWARVLVLPGSKEDDFLFPFCGLLVADFGEEHRHGIELLFGPLIRPHAQESQGDALGYGGRLFILHGPVKIDLGHAKIAPAGNEQFAGKLVVRHVRAQGRVNPMMIGLGRIGPQIDGKFGFDPEQVAPLHRPVVCKFVPGQ